MRPHVNGSPFRFISISTSVRRYYSPLVPPFDFFVFEPPPVRAVSDFFPPFDPFCFFPEEVDDEDDDEAFCCSLLGLVPVAAVVVWMASEVMHPQLSLMRDGNWTQTAGSINPFTPSVAKALH
jgi:hypothetical protein